MIRTLVAKATVQQTHSVGEWFFKQGYSPEEVMLWLKDKHYTIKGTKFNGAYVANFVAGARMASATSMPTQDDAVETVNTLIAQGVLKHTKAKGVHVVPVVAKVEPVTTVADDEVPF